MKRLAILNRQSHLSNRRSSLITHGRRFVTLVLVGALLSPTVTLAAGGIGENSVLSFRGTGENSVIGIISSIAATFGLTRSGQDRGMPSPTRTPQMSHPQRPATKEERKARVKGIFVNPQGGVVMEPGQPLIFTAIPVDADGGAIQGLTAEWESSDNRILFVSPDGEAVGVRPGAARLTARAGNKKAVVNVVIVPVNVEKFGGRKPGSAVAAQSRKSGGTRNSEARTGFVAASGERTRSHHSIIPARYTSGAKAAAAAPATSTPLFNRAPEEDPLPDTQTSTLYQPANDVGMPRGKTEPGASTPPAAVASGTETPGSANFALSVPVVNLAGRGSAVSLALNYNSRIWHKSGSELTYDVDTGWPAPGFRLGYGQMEDQGNYGFTLTEPNGTRHEMRRTGPIGSAVYDSTDGTFIHFQKRVGGGTLTYTDGSRVEYGAAGNGYRSYPIKIVDHNGNYISISYAGVNGVGPRISSIQDTLGRYVRFYYQNDELTSVTVPKLEGTASEETTTVRFYYGTIDLSENTLQNLFNTGLVTLHAPSTARVIRYVYYPGTGLGYRYDYSPYGMIRQVVQLREMQTANFDLDPLHATVNNDGQWAASTLYNYPNSPAALSDAPTYGSRTDDWVGRTTPGQPVFGFEEDEATGISRVIAPDGSVSETKTIVATGVGEEWRNGLVEETLLKASQDPGAVVLARTRFDWVPGGTNLNPRLNKVWTTDETGETRAVVYDSYDSYNNVLVVSERDFAAYPLVGAELRRTETDYKTTAAYVNRRLVHLPVQVRVKVNNAVVSRVDYEYDEGTLLARGATAVTGHEQAFNPDAPQVWRCHYVPKCDPEDLNCGCEYQNQYDPTTAQRGNLTSVKAYSNAADIAAGTTTENTTVYDILGNVVEQTVNCCRRKTFTYTDSYKFAYPETVTRGDASLQLSTSTVYDFNTGLVTITTDENLQETTVSYDLETQLPARVDRPAGGGSTEFFQEEELLNGPGGTPRYSRSFTKTSFESGRAAVESYQYFDGRGAVVRSFNSYTASDGWVTVDVEYDVMGRAWRASNPYYSAGATAVINPPEFWTTSSGFDKLGRATEVTLPDGAKVSTAFAGRVTTVTDQAGRQRRQVTDSLGRVREVHEPDAAGSLGAVASPVQKTVYEYDALNNLTKVTQAGSYGGSASVTQERVFKYDSLSRLTHQRSVEAAARLNDSGAVVTSGGEWSRVMKYDAWGNVTDGYDARGVHSHIEYDTLNRVHEITYSDGTPTLTYTYDEARVDAQGQSYANQGRLTKVATAAAAVMNGAPATAQEYDYDRMGRTVAQRQGVGSDTYALSYKYNLAGQLTEETYPSGRVVKQSYDDAARVVSVGNVGGTQLYASGLKYAAHGGLESETLGNSTVQAMAYNSRLQLKTHTLKRGQTPTAEVIQSYTYKYGVVDQATGTVDETKNAGQIAKVESYIGGTVATPTKQWEERFSYDTLGRLAQASERRADNGQQVWHNTYAYDRFGNRYQPAADQQALPYTPVEASDIDRATNRFIAPTTTTSGVEYDYAGHVTRDTKFRLKQFQYDANGRMTRAANLDDTNATTAVYDGSGQRVQTMYAGQARVMVYDISGQVVAEYGQPENDGGGLRYVFTDQQGSTRAVLDGQGQVKARRDYAPFGEEIGAVGTRAGVVGYNSADETRQQYAQTERDKETKLDHTTWRKYDSGAGRWTSPDPYNGSMSVGDPQSFNRYAYVGNDPINAIDPSGLNVVSPGTTFGSGILWTLLYGNNVDGWRIISQWFEPYGSNSQDSSSAVLDSAAKRAVARITDKCKDFFNKINGGVDSAQKLEALRQEGSLIAGKKYLSEDDGKEKAFTDSRNAARTLSTTIGNTRYADGLMFYNEDSFFFTGKYSTPKGDVDITKLTNSSVSNLSLNEIQELVILHELVHIIDVKGQYNDKDVPNGKLNNEIRAACFK